jgi:DNA polymerase elongation subunit (family B)
MSVQYKLCCFDVKDTDGFTIELFGIDEDRVTYVTRITDFCPFLYIRVGDDWTTHQCDAFMAHFRKHENVSVRMSIKTMVNYKIVSRKSLYGFDGGKYHTFIYITCKDMKLIYAIKQLYYNKDSAKVFPYVYEGTPTTLYECMVPPLLRFFHIQEISPSGWIQINDYEKVKYKSTHCKVEISCSSQSVLPIDKDTFVPYKICSFDIEASSSHGDFPEAIKDYKKVAYDMVYHLEKVSKEDYPTLIKELILNVFDKKQTLSIDRCYPKKPPTEDRLLLSYKSLMAYKVVKKEETENKIQKYFQVEEPEHDHDHEGEGDSEHNDFSKKVQYKTIEAQSDLVDFLSNPGIDTPVKIVYLMDVLGQLFPALEGDQVTFIGSTFMSYGSEQCSLQHCICVQETDTLLDQHTLECYKTETEALVAWSELIRREDPDIIIGYNIFGFDFKFMFERSKELDCVDAFMNLGRTKEYSCEVEETKIVLASGPYDLTRIPMKGRLLIDMYTYMRKEFNLSSYKLDAVSGYLLSDTVKRYENQEDDTCRIWSKNLKGIEEGCFIHFEIINHSCDLYEEGRKFQVIGCFKDGFTIKGNLKCTDTLTWGLAKDDVSPQEIFKWTHQGPSKRGLIAKYCIQDCNLVHQIFQKVDILTTFVEMSKLCSVPIDFLVMRGQGIKGTSYVAKKCRENDVLMPFISKGNPFELYEGAIVLEPKCNLYLEDPIACLDYGSLYPSSIISENLSHDSKVWTKEYDTAGAIKLDRFGKELITGIRDKQGKFVYDNLEGYDYVDVTYDTFEYKKTGSSASVKVLTGFKVCRFAQYPDGKKAILPSILQELLAARKSTKKQMEKELDPFQKNILDKRQLSIKVTANSLYGQCGAKTSTFYEMDVAASTTAIGRKLLKYGKEVVETVYKDTWVDTKYGKMHTAAEYIYGDTDSIFFTFHLSQDEKKVDPQRALEVTIELAQEAGALATRFLKKPHDLEYEKTFLPFCLLSKKRYVGMLYEYDPTYCKRKSMGIVLKRRDNAPIVKDVYGGIIDILMTEKDVQKSMDFLNKMLLQIVEKKVPIEKLMISKSLRSFYKNPKQIAHHVLAERIGIRDPGNKPAPGDRINYIYIVNPKAKLQGDRIETPAFIEQNKLKIDYGIYITNQIMKPVLQLFTLVLYDMPKFRRRKASFLLELQSLKQSLEFEKYEKKEQTLKQKEAEKILFEHILRDNQNDKTGNQPMTKFFTKKN